MAASVARIAAAKTGWTAWAPFDFSRPRTFAYAECAALLSAASGRRIVYTRPSGREFARHLATQGFSQDYVRVMRGIYLVSRLRLAGRLTDELPRLLGRPAITFAQFAADNAGLLDEPVA